jgi:hypothetical protein
LYDLEKSNSLFQTMAPQLEEEEAAPLGHTLVTGAVLRGCCWGWPALASLVRAATLHYN